MISVVLGIFSGNGSSGTGEDIFLVPVDFHSS